MAEPLPGLYGMAVGCDEPRRVHGMGTQLDCNAPDGWQGAFCSGAPGSPSCCHCNTASATELIDGKAIAEDIRKELKAEVEQLQAKYGKVGRAGGC